MSMLSDMGINVVEDDEPRPKRARRSRRASRGGGGRARRADRHRRRAPDHQEGADRPHRRSGAHVPARDGLGGAAVPRGRNRHRQAHRGRPRDHDRRPVREPADLPGHHHLARRAQRRPRSCCARSSTSRPPMPVPRPSRPGRRAHARGRWPSRLSRRKAPPGPREDDDVTNVGARHARVEEEDEEDEDEAIPVAGRDGSGAAPAGAWRPSTHRRHLQEAAQAAGPAGREPPGGLPARCRRARSAG